MEAKSGHSAAAAAPGKTPSRDKDENKESPPIQLTAATTAKDVLASLKRQGISDLEEFVDELVTAAKAKAEEEHGEDDDVWRLNLIVHDHYVITYGGVATMEAAQE